VIILQVTRAEYFGFGLGTAAVCVAWAIQGRTPGQAPFRGRVAAGTAALVLIIMALIVIPVAEDSTVGAASHSVTSGIESLQNGTGTVATRENEASAILGAVNGRWLAGLGFWSPSSHYFAGVPAGEIRNSDVGVLNLYATEGVVGVLLLYVPLLGLLMVIMAFPSWGGFNASAHGSPEIGEGQGAHAWLLLGTGIWLATVLASSVTLVDLFSRPGCALAGHVIGLGLAILVTAQPTGPFSPWSSSPAADRQPRDTPA
jgi:hypothetical protein